MYIITVITIRNSFKTSVIRSLKCPFRKLVLLRMIECIDKKEVYSVNLLDAVRFVHKAWDCVTEKNYPRSGIKRAKNMGFPLLCSRKNAFSSEIRIL